jgi:hypothetical protein
MRGLVARFCAGMVLALAFAVSAVAEGEREGKAATNSGFLGDDSVYARLETVKLANGGEAKRWLGPSMTFSNYQKVLVDEVIMYPRAEPGPQVSQETLEAIQAYLSDGLRRKVGAAVSLATEPGPGVLRMQTAVTGVAIKTEGMKAYEVLPVAAVFGGLKAASGTRDMDVHVFAEARFVDSQTGELVGAAMRVLEGRDLKGKKDQLQLEDVKDSLDDATDGTSAVLADVLRGSGE